MSVNYINFNNKQHIILENFFTPEFINEIYEDIKKSKYMEKFSESTLNYIQRNHSVMGNYNYTIEPRYISNYSNLVKIIDSFNIIIKNSLIMNNNSYITKKFTVNLKNIELCLCRKNTITSPIIKSSSINIFIPLHEVPYTGGTISIFSKNLIDNTDSETIFSKYYIRDEINKNINYNFLENYDEEDKKKITEIENFFKYIPGNVIIINNNTFTRSLLNDTNQDRICLQLIYDYLI